jgi:hypothetical protein
VLIGEERAAQIKLQSDDCELNVVMSADDLPMLKEIASAKWSARNCLKLGTCLGTSVFWSCEDGSVSVLVGDDEEVWEVGMTLPESVLVQLEGEAARLSKTG